MAVARCTPVPLCCSMILWLLTIMRPTDGFQNKCSIPWTAAPPVEKRLSFILRRTAPVLRLSEGCSDSSELRVDGEFRAQAKLNQLLSDTVDQTCSKDYRDNHNAIFKWVEDSKNIEYPPWLDLPEISVRLFDDDGSNFDCNPFNCYHFNEINYINQQIKAHLNSMTNGELSSDLPLKKTAGNALYSFHSSEHRQRYIQALKTAVSRIDLNLTEILGSSKQDAIFRWVEINGGYVNPKVELTTGPDPSWTIRGVFATEPLLNGEKIFELSPELIFSHDSLVHTVTALTHEISLGQESFWWPYLSHLEELDIDSPSFWTEEERDLLSGLSPFDWSRHLDWYKYACNGDINNADGFRALKYTVTRTNQKLDHLGNLMFCLTPLYDFMNHAHEKNFKTVHGQQSSTTICTTEDVGTGQQLFNNYGSEDVGKMFRDYGFIPDYPRLWIFDGDKSFNNSPEIIFRVFEDNGKFAFDFNPYEERSTSSLAYTNHKIKLHLTTVLANEPLGFRQASASVRSERYSAALTYRQEYIKDLEAAIVYIDSCSWRSSSSIPS